MDASGGDPGHDGGTDAGSAPTSPRRIDIDNLQGPEALDGLVVRVPLDASRIDYTMVADPRTDLAFTAANGAQALAFDVDHWDPSGTSDVWVRVPSIPAGEVTSILMRFGPGVGAASPSAVWAGYELVQHLEPPLADATGHATTAGHGVTAGPGAIGQAAVFPGGGDHQIDFSTGSTLFDGWSQFTIELWLYADYASAAALPAGAQPRVLDKGGSLELGRLYVDGNGHLEFQIDAHFNGGGNDAYLSAVITPRTWTDVAYSYDGGTLTMYADGVPGDTFTVNNPPRQLNNDSRAFYLGDAADAFAGSLDELHAERTGHSAAWMAAMHRSMTGQLVSFHDP